MRVNQPQMRGNQQRMQMQGQRPSVSQQPVQNPHIMRKETEVMQLARKIKTEQGSQTAGRFLFAVRPYAAPNEIAYIERELNIKMERDPRFDNQSQQVQNRGGMDNSGMMQMMMNLMRGGGKVDPMSLLKMMNKK